MVILNLQLFVSSTDHDLFNDRYLSMKNIKILWITILLFPVSLTDYYSTLNVKRDATTKEIRSAFKKLALSSHPDKNKVRNEILLISSNNNLDIILYIKTSSRTQL